uniref:Uncharacterized protein n=1 Tax=Lactuca sativa TaxID=4236 RepID=A0A9R1X0Z5_LACSA|nr:hypothetical protein LSAT_V11C800416270 [Lactuca sativa]
MILITLSSSRGSGAGPGQPPPVAAAQPSPAATTQPPLAAATNHLNHHHQPNHLLHHHHHQLQGLSQEGDHLYYVLFMFSFWVYGHMVTLLLWSLVGIFCSIFCVCRQLITLYLISNVDGVFQ